MSKPVTPAQLRARAVAVQGYAARNRSGRPAEVEAAIERLGAVQLDSISAVERSHRIALSSRVGAYPRGTVSRLLAAGRIFEYWAHEACLLPIADWPLYRREMLDRPHHRWWGAVIDRDPQLADRVLGEIRERGAMGSRHFEGTGGGGMWNLKPAKRILEALWHCGQLVIAGRQGFQRMYDLPERVIPDAVLGAPVPSAGEVLAARVLRAVHARGVLTEAGIVEHCRLRGGIARIRPHVQALIDEGRLVRLAVTDSGPPVLVPADAAEPAVPRAPVLLSPFDNLLWDRPFARRIFGFDHLIEVYKPQPQRRYGYYVLPLLVGDRLVARFDLRCDRRAGVLRVLAQHPQPGVRWGVRHEAAADTALARLARATGMTQVDRPGGRSQS